MATACDDPNNELNKGLIPSVPHLTLPPATFQDIYEPALEKEGFFYVEHPLKHRNVYAKLVRNLWLFEIGWVYHRQQGVRIKKSSAQFKN